MADTNKYSYWVFTILDLYDESYKKYLEELAQEKIPDDVGFTLEFPSAEKLENALY